MIIQAARLRVTVDVPGLVAHVFHGPANTSIAVLHGDAEDLATMRRDAFEAGKTFAIRHIKISPGEPTSRLEAARIMRDLAGGCRRELC